MQTMSYQTSQNWHPGAPLYRQRRLHEQLYDKMRHYQINKKGSPSQIFYRIR